MYTVGDALPVEQIDAGAFLLSGPAMSGKYELLLDLVTDGFDHGDGGLVVTTNQGSDAILRTIESRYGTIPEALRIVDCVSERHGTTDRIESDRVEYVSSPGDLTGIGIGLSEQLRRFTEADIERVRIGFYSLSTLLMYAELETVFRFMHVFVGRIDSLDGLGLLALDPTTHDESTVSTLKQLFGGVIEVRDDGSTRSVRVAGVPDAPSQWTPRA